MKSWGIRLIWIMFAGLLVANSYVFVHSISVSNEIAGLEQSIKKIEMENQQLENKVFMVDSLTFAASRASELNFVKKASPMYLERLNYARR